MIKAILFDCFGVVLSLYNERNDSMIDYIRMLKPDYKLALVSNVRGRESLERHFKEGELDELFDAVLPSGDIGFEKPDHRIYDLALERLDVEAEEAVFIDDIPEFCEAAEKVGMQSIHCVDIAMCIKDIQTLIDRDKEKY